ncbi:phosphonate degradation HD-domain oxygenase [Bordetella sp. 2513F-2]
MSTPALTPARIAALFEGYGSAYYGDEAVTQTQHALQCARLAEQAGEAPELVAAALLHDLGHLLQAESRNLDMRHQDVAARSLAPLLGPAVTEPIRLHVAAKRYLCAADPSYHATLSPASQASLVLQGGPYDEAGRREFAAHAHAEAALRLRRYDDVAKDADAVTPPLAHYMALVEGLARG